MTKPSDDLPSVLAPTAAFLAARKERGFDAVLQKVILHASTWPPQDFLRQVYLAGLWHGTEIMRRRKDEIL